MRYIALFFLIALTPMSAQAYIGPGLGVTLLGYVFGPIAAVLGAIALVAYFPARYLYKKYKRKKAEAAKEDGADNPEN